MRNQSSRWILSTYSYLTPVVNRYRTFVRIGSGLTFADYVWVRAKPWKPWDLKEPPSFLLTANKSHDDKGDVYLEPEE
jgi:DNA ligase-4